MIRVRNLLATITLSVLGVFFMLGNVQAATVGTMQGLITEPDGTPIVGVATNLYDGSGNYISFVESNALGYVNFFGIEEGAYVLQVRPSESWNCPACGIYDSQDVDLTVSTASSSYNPVSDIFSLSTIQLAPASRYVTVTVIDDSNNPVPGMYVNGFPNASNGVECNFETDTCYIGGTTNIDGQLQKAIGEDVAGTWNFFANPFDISGYTLGEQQNVTIAAIGETAVTITVQATDSSISGNLVDQNGDAVSVPVDGWGSVNCFDTNTYTNYAFDNLSPGDSSYFVDVIGDMNYQCSIWLDGYGGAMNDITVPANTDVTSNLVLYAKTATANVQPIDADGNVITDVNFSAFGYTVIDMPSDDKTAPLADTQINDYAWGMGSNGTAELSLIDGVEYEVGLFVEQSFEGPGDDPAPKSEMRGIRVSASGTNYIQDYSMERIVADEKNIQTVQRTLQVADAAFEVTVTDSKGNKQAAGVDAHEITNNPNSWGMSMFSYAENGTTSLNVLSGKTYEIMAWPQGAFDPTAKEKVLPASVRGITPKAGQTMKINLQTVIADYALGLDVHIQDTATEPDFYYCYGYEPENGRNQFTYEKPDQIDITSTNTWYIGCMGYAGATFYRSADIEYNPSAQAVDDTLVVELREAGNYYETQSYSFSATAATTLTLQDGLSTINVPANTIDTSGTVSMVVSTPFQYAVTDSTNPFVVYDIDAFDSTGQQVTSLNSNIVIKLSYDPELVTELGIDLENILGSTYDEDNKKWGTPSVSMEVDTVNNLIIITTNTLSMYGGVGDKNLNAVSKPNKPRSLKAKNIKQYQAKLTWKKPQSSTVTKYKVQLRKNKVKKIKQWKQYKNVKKRSKVVKKLDSDTVYQFRVRAKNSAGWSNWAKWKQFTTKPLAE